MSRAAPFSGGSGVARFFRMGVVDVGRRLSRFAARDVADDRPLVTLLEASRVVQATAAACTAVRRAQRHSLAAATVARLGSAWSACERSTQARLAGTALLTAVATHVTLMEWQEVPPGWFWLIVPAMAMSVGAVLILASAGRGRSGRT